jgi:nucleoside-diphosphate-sugar epimerase
MRNAVVGCGFVGKRLARILVDEGEDVVAVTRSGVSLEGVESIERDVTGTYELPDVDRVFYLVSAGGRDADAYRSAYVDGLRNTLEATDAPVVYSSSTGVYEADDASWVDETTGIEPTKERTRVLLRAEEAARDAGGTAVRFGGLYGSGRVGVDRYLGETTVKAGYLNLIRGRDAASALLAAHEGDDDLYVAVDNEPVHRHDLARWMSERVGRPHGELVDETRTPNKRCSNERLRSTGWTPEYPTYREGYAPLLRG